MNVIGKLINGGFTLFFGLIIILALGGASFHISENRFVSVSLVLLLAIAAFGLFLLTGKLEKYFANKFGSDKKKYRTAFVIMTLFLIAVQTAVAVFTDFTPKNDLSYLCQGAENVLRNGADHLYDGLPQRHQHYFAVYPNNHMLYLIILALYKIEFTLTGNITNFLPIAVNIIGLDISYILMYKSAKLIYSPEKALTCSVKGLLFTPLFTYSQIFYTDSISMPWLTAAVYVYLKWRKSSDAYNDHNSEDNINNSINKESRRSYILRSCLYLLLCGIFTAIAYKIKGSNAILLPAIFLDLIFRRKGIVKKFAPTAAIAAVFCLSCLLLSSIVNSVLKIDKNELYDYEFPLIHWVMMSADGNGGYNVNDFYYTKSYKGYDHKVSADITRLSDKISEQGAGGFAAHLAYKASYTWENGGYMADYYLNSAVFHNKAFYIMTALCHFTLLFSVLSSFAAKVRSKTDVIADNFVLKLMFIGITVFLLIWEARCRYLVSFFMLFPLL